MLSSQWREKGIEKVINNLKRITKMKIDQLKSFYAHVCMHFIVARNKRFLLYIVLLIFSKYEGSSKFLLSQVVVEIKDDLI